MESCRRSYLPPPGSFIRLIQPPAYILTHESHRRFLRVYPKYNNYKKRPKAKESRPLSLDTNRFRSAGKKRTPEIQRLRIRPGKTHQRLSGRNGQPSQRNTLSASSISRCHGFQIESSGYIVIEIIFPIVQLKIVGIHFGQSTAVPLHFKIRFEIQRHPHQRLS